MRTVILTLGRLPKALDLARSFAANGWRVVVAEPFRRHLTGASRAVALSRQVTAPSVSRARYLDDLARVAREEGAELVVPVSEEAVHAAFVRDRLGEGVRLFAMPPETVVRLHDKHAFAMAADAMGLSYWQKMGKIIGLRRGQLTVRSLTHHPVQIVRSFTRPRAEDVTETWEFQPQAVHGLSELRRINQRGNPGIRENALQFRGSKTEVQRK